MPTERAGRAVDQVEDEEEMVNMQRNWEGGVPEAEVEEWERVGSGYGYAHKRAPASDRRC